MEREQLKMFFTRLADRFRKENDLSDVTWALCEACPDFAQLFLSFFFEEITDTAGISLEREYSQMSSRPDFFFFHSNTKYIIEVKKWDMNDHFEQYKNDCPGFRFGWIANYRVANRTDGIQTRTWEGLKLFLEANRSKNTLIPDTANVIDAYCAYIASVCSIVKFTQMKLDNLTSLHLFRQLVDELIETKRHGIKTALYTRTRSTWDDRSGATFTIQKTDSPNEPIYAWFGIYYDEKTTCVCMGFRQDWCKPVYDGVTPDAQAGTSFIKPYKEDNAVWFEMKGHLFEQFNDKTDVSEQKKLIEDFYREVLNTIATYL